MNWEQVEEQFIGAISAGVHPKGMSRTEFIIARKIYLLQEIHGNIEYYRWWIHVIRLETDYKDIIEISKNEGSKIKRAVTRRINQLKQNLIQSHGLDEPSDVDIFCPDVKLWRD